MAKGKWQTVSIGDIQPGVKKTGPHNLTKKIFHWPYCSKCGLVALKNKRTKKALRKCVWWED